MTGQALLDSIDDALHVVDGDFAPHAAGDIQQNEPPVGLVEDDDLGRFVEKIVNQSLVEDRQPLALRLGLAVRQRRCYRRENRRPGPPSVASAVPEKRNNAAASTRYVGMGRLG